MVSDEFRQKKKNSTMLFLADLSTDSNEDPAEPDQKKKKIDCKMNKVPDIC